jgi:hypothetical protein
MDSIFVKYFLGQDLQDYQDYFLFNHLYVKNIMLSIVPDKILLKLMVKNNLIFIRRRRLSFQAFVWKAWKIISS